MVNDNDMQTSDGTNIFINDNFETMDDDSRIGDSPLIDIRQVFSPPFCC